MTREHDIEELAVYIRQGLVNLKNHRPEFCDFAWANRDAMIRALSSLAAENGWLRGALEDTAWRAKQDTEDEWRSVLEDRLKTIAENARAALSSPTPKGVTGGDEFVP